ncbi:hypothetical protein [Bradyrhizobium sp. CCGB01]|uniref:hypothetical protein n=1 Tax=Bradyrhizobium sp. CCGB01 TaxID=2949634 RepID=UPI0020B1884C|nr:hypothetical protein [Bradyrhizobium sp. CCGB01]MCP3408817.1 hypothetical protein [Bradyrhizobium sp. CCGB01]
MTDTTPETIYAAVGQALSKWETLEAHLSFTYSIFEGRPVDHDLLERYGHEGRIFKDRMNILNQSAERYFRRKPDQAEEARFKDLVSDAVRLSNLRHRIAHGMVAGAEVVTGQFEFWLVPPAHGFFHLTKRDGDYRYSSEDIDRCASEFMEHATQIQKFNHERHPPNSR